MTDALLNLTNPDKLFIGGDWSSSSGSNAIEIVSPSTEETIGRVVHATSADMDRAVATARDALDNGPWPRMAGAERAPYLRRIAEEMAKRADDFARAWTLQVGMPYTQSSGAAPHMGGYYSYYADLAEQGFDRARVQELIAEHRSGRRDNPLFVWVIYNLAAWHAHWIEGR